MAPKYDSLARHLVRAALRMITVVVTWGLVSRAVAMDWQQRERFVGIWGQVGTYEEVQQNLAHLEWQEVRGTNQPANHSLKDLYDGQMAWRKSLESIEVSFDYSMQRRMDTARVIALKAEKRAVPDNFSFEARLAIKGDKRFTHTRETTAIHVPAGGNPGRQRPPAGEFVYAYDGAEMRNFEPLRSIGYIHRAKLDAVDSKHLWYFDAISMPTGSRVAKQEQSAWYLPIALSLPSVYHVLPHLQDVDGYLCHVVTSGPDTIWIDTEHGCCMRRRVWFQMSNLKRPPVLSYIYVNKEFQDDSNGIWLPHLCYRLDFAGTSEPANTQGRLTEVHTVASHTVHVNTIPDELFELKFPPGTTVQDLVKNKSYIVPNGENLLDEAITRANPIVNGEVLPFRSGAGSGSIWRQLLVLNAVVLLFIVGRLLWRRWAERSSEA
jgi:hypothetical protein